VTATGAQSDRGGVALLAIVGLAVAIRVIYALFEAPWPPPALDDQFYFSALPKLIADGHGFSAPFRYAFDDVVVATAEHPPLYSLVLALPASVGLDSDDAFRLVGALFGGGIVAVAGLLGRHIGGWRTGLPAAGLAAVHPALIAADGALMSESLYGLLAALVLLAALRLLDGPTARRALALGVVAGLAALTRGEALLLLPLVLAPIVRRPDGLRAAALATLAFVVVLTPWTVRNWAAFDRPVLVATNSGTAVAGANCEETYAGSRLGGWWPNCIREHPGNEAEHHSEALRDGLRYAGDHTGRLPVVLAARLGRVWSVYDPFQIPEGRSPRVQKAGVLFYFLLVPLAVVGALALRRRRAALWVMLTPVIVVSLTALLTYGNVRFRESAEISELVLAAVGIDALWRRR
jgi:4-amino-4-deoxy-L-arabinose transferase-like glycosyltransferase